MEDKECYACATQRQDCEHEFKSDRKVRQKSEAIRKKIGDINVMMECVWKGFPHDSLDGKQTMVSMLKNIRTNSDVVIQMLEEMSYQHHPFKTKGVRND